MPVSKRIVGVVVVLAAGAAAFAWFRSQQAAPPAGAGLVLHGEVDLRQAEIAFNLSERVTEVLVEEGARVKRGDALARLDRTRLEPQLARAVAGADAARDVVARLRAGSRPEEIAHAEAVVAAAEQSLARLVNGTRPEEIARARAEVDAIRADAVNAKQRFERLVAVNSGPGGRAVGKQEEEDAKSAWDVAEARLVVAQRSLDLAVAGPRAEDIAEARASVAVAQATLDLARAGARKEDIDEAEARQRAAEASVAALQRDLAETELVAPTDGVVRTRLLEPGELASPQRAAFSLAVTDPKWVRAWVAEPDVARAKPGVRAAVSVDSFPNRTFDGWIGFVSNVAEFTPKQVQTEELRPSLVYEVRVFVKDPQDELRLGMPATVHVLSVDAEQGTDGPR